MVEPVMGVEMSSARSLREVSLTALWEPFQGLMAADVGDLLSELRHDYPTTTEVPAMPPWTNGEPSSATLASNETPPYSWWMTNEPGNSLVRFQFDRITYSWRRVSSGKVYPGYENTRASFAHLVVVVGQWLSSKRTLTAELAKAVQHVQVDYVNRIDMAPMQLLGGIVVGGQESPSRASPLIGSLGTATLERGGATIDIESDGWAGSTLTVTSATQVEGNAGYLTHLDQAQRRCQEAFLAITPAQLLTEWGKLDDGGIRQPSA